VDDAFEMAGFTEIVDEEEDPQERGDVTRMIVTPRPA